MHWEVLIIPLIALGVWILGTLFRSDDKMKKDVRRPGNSSGRGPSRRPVTDLDRFLEEARRRREAEERPQPPPPPPARPTPPRQRPTPPRETPRVAPPVLRKREEPIAVPIARPVEETVRAEPVLVGAPPREALPPPPPAPTTTRDTRPSPILQQVHSLLSKPQTAGTAFVLREIFDRPLCKRRR